MMTTDGSIFASADFTLDESCAAEGTFATDVDEAAGVAIALWLPLSSMVWTTAPVAAAEMTTAATTAPLCRIHGRVRFGFGGGNSCAAADGSSGGGAAGVTGSAEDGKEDHQGIGSGVCSSSRCLSGCCS
jgi:hypothetical protein